MALQLISITTARSSCVLICSWSCLPVISATPCQTTLTGPCALRGRTSAFSYRVRVEQVKQRPPRRSSSTTPSPAPLMITWLPSVTACYSLTLFWRYVTVSISNWTATHWFIHLSQYKIFTFVMYKCCLMFFLFDFVIFLISLSPSDFPALLLCAGIWQRQNTEEWQLQPLWKIHGCPVWL